MGFLFWPTVAIVTFMLGLWYGGRHPEDPFGSFWAEVFRIALRIKGAILGIR